MVEGVEAIEGMPIPSVPSTAPPASWPELKEWAFLEFLQFRQ